MSNNLTIELKSVSDEDKKILMEIIERSKAPKNIAWKPAEGEAVYVLWTNGEITVQTYHNDHLFIAYEQGNIFLDKDGAEFEAKRRKLLKKWRDLSIESDESENEWDGSNRHWFCYYDYSEKHIQCSCYKDVITSNIYFATKESLLNAIKTIGEENVKKYILSVK